MNNKISRRTVIKHGGLALATLAMPFPLTSFIKHNVMTDKNKIDVIIIGGSYAGLSAAMALGRSLKNVLIIDSGKPCNHYTPHSHNFITHDGAVPGEISAIAKEQVLKYPTVKWLEGEAIYGKKLEIGFEIGTESGEKFTGKKLIFATGVKDVFPSINGFEECWGKSIIHCPYCHGYEFKGTKTAILANGERAFHIATLVNNLTDNLTIITQGEPDFSNEQFEKIKKHQIQIIQKVIKTVVHKNGKLSSVIFEDGKQEKFDTIYAAIPFEQHCAIPISLGCETTEMGHLKVDMFQKTTIPGIFSCGDNSTPMRSVAYAIATGNISGAMVNHELTTELF